MIASYKLIPVPLDSGAVDGSPMNFGMNIVSNLEFPPGTATAAAVTAAVLAHPLLGRAAGMPVAAVALEYAAWERAGRVINLAAGIPLKLEYAGAKPIPSLRDTLASYLGGSKDKAVSPLSHDPGFDGLTADNFVDIARAHDDLSIVRTEFHNRAATGLRYAKITSLDDFSYDKARWLNAHVQAFVTEAIFGDSAQMRSMLKGGAAPDAVGRLQDALRKVDKRLNSAPVVNRRVAVSPGSLCTTTPSAQTNVSLEDPNAAIHAALKNRLLGESCGLVTSWRVEASRAILGDYVLLLNVSDLSVNPGAVVVTTEPIAFRRSNYTHPLSFFDVGAKTTTNAGVALLNDENGEPRYRATTIHAETAVIQGTILQSNNSIANSTSTPAEDNGDYSAPRDDRPPQLLSDEHFGINELESAGLTVSAPIEDLVTPPALADSQRAAKLPCLFLEDLWVGFRMDIGEDSHGPLSSIHRQIQKIMFADKTTEVQGLTEEFFSREQPGDPTVGVSSTEILRYVGLNSAQARDYMKFLGTNKDWVPQPGAPFAMEVTSYSGATPLRFGKSYRYRLRNVFLGGIGLSDTDSNLENMPANNSQSCPFFRARAYRPGEIVSPVGESSSDVGGGGRTVFLTAEHPHARLWLVPTPLDIDAARYHGVFLANHNEPERNAQRAFVKDLSKFFKKDPSTLGYFFDPDVAEIVVRVTMLNGDPDSIKRDFGYQDGTYCELSQHLHLPPVYSRYGEDGKWEEFRPIEITLSASTERRPQVTSNRHFRGGSRIDIRVPAGGDVVVSMLPVVSNANLMRTAAYASSAGQLTARTRADDGTNLSANGLPVPALVEQKFRVVHCVKAPAANPRIASTFVQMAPAGQTVFIADRAKFQETAEFHGHIELDAATTGQVRLEVSWYDIDDSPIHQRYVLATGSAASAPRSVNFDKYQPPTGAAVARAFARGAAEVPQVGSLDLWDMFDLQCAENKIFLGPASPEQLAPQTGRACVLNLADARRKQISVTAVATSRYKSQFRPEAAARFETKSDPIVAEVPASMRLPTPDISHVVPLSRQEIQRSTDGRETRYSYAMRIYARRPWFLSGPCERIAVGCHAGLSDDGPHVSLDKFVTQWGEDPVERPKLEVTRRAPHASDFRVPENGTDVPLDGNLYPSRSIEGIESVVYRDNLVIPDGTRNPPSRALSLASYALRWEPTLRMWYCDVAVSEGFIGWCGIALYRHQPQAHVTCQISETPAWVYGAVLHGEPVAWMQRGEKLHVTVGPVFDLYTSFDLDSTEYRDGVSEDQTTTTHKRVPLRKYVANNQVYFEGIVDREKCNWSLMKTRFGQDVGSLTLVADRA
jgi:hypothetical protein